MGRFSKGLVKDTNAADQPEGSWRHARNAVVNRVDGAISTEGGITHVTDIGAQVSITGGRLVEGADGTRTNTPDYGTVTAGYTFIGKIEVTDDRIVIFSVCELAGPSLGRSEIGIYSAGTYNTVLNPDITVPNVDTDLKFSTEHPITGTYKITAKGDLVIYFTDYNVSPKSLNVTRQFPSTDSVTTSWVYGVNPLDSPNKNYIDRLNLYPHSGPVPHIEFKAISSGGGLVTAVYALALAYADVDLVSTNYLTVDNPVPLTDSPESSWPIEKYDGAPSGSQTGKSITWDVSNLNTDYDYLRPAVIQTVGGVVNVFQLSDIAITGRTTSITFTGVEGYLPAAIEDVIIDTVSYDKVKSLEQVDGVLYAGNVEGSLDVGFQKYAGDITLKPKTKSLPFFDPFDIGISNLTTGVSTSTKVADGKDSGYRLPMNSYKYRGYARDEVYAFYVAFVLNNGSMSYGYHIPGRKPIATQLQPEDHPDLQALGTDVEKYNFRSLGGGNSMDYWENSNEYYPDTENYNSSEFKEDNGDMKKSTSPPLSREPDKFKISQV